MMTRLIGYALLSIMLSACRKETPEEAPVIRLLDVNATTIMQFSDSLVINIEYEDANGDIGETDPDKNALRIKDRRLTEADLYFIRPLAPPGSNIRVKGVISVKVRNTFLLGTGNTEITNFDIRLSDRAGHWSNSISTPEITIKK